MLASNSEPTLGLAPVLYALTLPLELAGSSSGSSPATTAAEAVRRVDDHDSEEHEDDNSQAHVAGSNDDNGQASASTASIAAPQGSSRAQERMCSGACVLTHVLLIDIPHHVVWHVAAQGVQRMLRVVM